MAGFAEQIRKFAVVAEGIADEVVKEAIEEVGRRVVVRSPILTGRFVSNWNYAPGAPDINETTLTNVRKVNRIDAIPDKATAFTHFISNSLPYATRLEHGYSKKAPQGMIGVTAVEWEAIVADAALKVAK